MNPSKRTLPPPHLPLVLDLGAWDRTIRALAGHRLHELLDLVATGRVLPLPPDAELEVEEDLATLLRVRVVDGESRGAVGWIPAGRLPRRRAA